MHKTLSTIAAGGLLVAALSACSVPTGGVAGPAGQPGPAVESSPQRPATSPAFAVSRTLPGTSPWSEPDAYDRVLADAEALQPILDDFWTAHLYDDYGLEFDAPDRFEFYVDEGNSTCGDGYVPGTDNAYYCAVDGDEYIAFDVDWLASYLPEHPGNAITFLVLAHEWGHAVQDTWVEQQPGVDHWSGPAQELNADCLAGAFWDDAVREGTIIEEDGDAEAVYTWLAEGGSGSWMDPGDHGSSEQRQLAFSDGFTYGVDYCRVNY